jgi:Ser/Thr protein kinase RdoA (MazF antagonist)
MDEITRVAAQLYEQTGRVARSGAVITRKSTKTVFILDCDDGSYIVAAYRDDDYARSRLAAARVGMLLASMQDLSPRPIDLKTTSLLHGYRFAPGPTLDHCTDLAQIYYEIGGFVGRFHKIEIPLQTSAEELLTRVADHGLPDWVLQRVAGDGTASRSVFLHGDLNSSNLILSDHRWLAIDFDSCGTGPPELDLAIALGYVNTHQAEWLSCFSAAVNGYRDGGGGRLCIRRLVELASVTPFYMLCSSIGPACDAVTRELLMDAAYRQHRDIETAVAALAQ